MPEIRGADLAAALSARRELGPDYDEAVADRLAEQLNDEIARRVAARQHTERTRVRTAYSSGQKVLVTIVALVVGMLASGIVATTHVPWMGLVVWAAVVAVVITVSKG